MVESDSGATTQTREVRHTLPSRCLTDIVTLAHRLQRIPLL